MVLIFKYFFPGKYVGLTLWPVIILKHAALKSDKVLLNHERIHLRQQLELLIVPFYLIYFTEWLIGLVRFRNSYEAYRNISFEKEAYLHEAELDYLSGRQLWAFSRYYRS
ncbi:hypothetical protein [Robertkochia aurantiaca]|uniref:hypothetical protein n=1 Tax=Robertkochia aurantiaca TaxID=2873700 RepID=UPI001CC92035|nr:hypothetical protein [Robertkochia sp. 3YJGBD-33]